MAKAEHLSQAQIERGLAGLVNPRQMKMFTEHLSVCAACVERWQAAQEQREQFLKRHDPVRESLALLAGKKQNANLSILVPALVAVTVILVFFLWPKQRLAPDPPEILSKGDALFSYQVLRPGLDRAILPAEGQVFMPQDEFVIRVYPPQGLKQVGIFSMDHKGQLSLLMNYHAQASGPLPQNLVLDDSPNMERIFVLFASQALEIEEVKQAGQLAFEAAGQSLPKLQRFVIPGEKYVRMDSILVLKKKPPIP